MSSTIVLDSSVVIKLLLPEDLASQARGLYADVRRQGGRIVAPALLPAEVGNGIYQQVRRQRITSDEADDALSQYVRLGIQIAHDSGLSRRAYDFARSHRLPAIYDSHYVVLAQSLDAEFWTDDRRLINSLGAAVPWVRWIGQYPVTGMTTS